VTLAVAARTLEKKDYVSYDGSKKNVPSMRCYEEGPSARIAGKNQSIAAYPPEKGRRIPRDSNPLPEDQPP
jgi:hypothetical protein